MIRRWISWWGRFLDKHAPVIDWPDIGSDDYAASGFERHVAEALNGLATDPHLDPNRHWREVGCTICRDRLFRIRVMVESRRPLHFEQWANELGVKP